MPRSQWSAPAFKNPLIKKLGSDFFAQIPRGPGVYFFKSSDGDILYVGKAKNLRARLLSYRRAKPERGNRKVIRLLRRMATLEWEELASEKDALLRENKFLRELSPEFNVVNTSPERYYFVGVQVLECPHEDPPLQVRFKLTRNPKEKSFKLFGSFRSSRRMKEGYAALLRLVWTAQNRELRFQMPSRLARRSPPHNYTTGFRLEWVRSLESFLEGRSHQLLVQILEALLENPFVPDFMVGSLQNDIEIARHFFRRGPRINRRIRLTHALPSHLIPQDAIDDFLVHEAVRQGRVEDNI
ncbi:MAG: GIY-YIG nuclease family protein [Bdellovibrionales bacterium]|nr:GIY-YIG nuclease family protein [Bdellovibrionales bacterium]